MSTCPSNNIHSLYVDNELSQSLRHNFEKHLTTCDSCSKKVEQYKNIHKDLRSLDVTPDVEEGYKRLKARLSYKTHLAPYGSARDPNFVFKVTPFLAAAAILAVFFPLMNLFTEKDFNTQTQAVTIHNGFFFPSVNTSQIVPIQSKGIVLDEDITMARINAHEYSLFDVDLDASELTEVDVFKPNTLKDDIAIEIILFDSPALVLHETDNFGLSNPVFLLRE